MATYLGHQVTSRLWHHRLSHPSNSIVSHILRKSNVSRTSDSLPIVCSPWLKGKFSKLPFPMSPSKSAKPFEIIHSDVWGLAPCISVEGFKYYVTFIDECTRFCWIFQICNKSEVGTTFVFFYHFIVNQFNAFVKVFQSDGGDEYIGKPFQNFMVDKGIIHHMSCPHTP